jgi:hypothetical protein
VDDINNYASKMEELLEENAYLKRKAGLPEDITIDLSDLKLARHGQMMQIRAMNKLLEEVGSPVTVMTQCTASICLLTCDVIGRVGYVPLPHRKTCASRKTCGA